MYSQSTTRNEGSDSSSSPKFALMRAALAADLTHAQFHVYAVLWDHSDGQGRNSRPSLATIVRESKCSEKTVITSLKALAAAGLIEQTAKGGGRDGRNWASVYRMTFPVPVTITGGVPVTITGTVPVTITGVTDPASDPATTLSTTAVPRIEDSSTEEGNGDRIPAEVLDAVQALAADPFRLETVEAFEDTVAPVYGREVAEWITNSGVVHFEAGLSRYKAGARLRSALATARREGVGVIRFPAPRNVVDLHSDESSRIQAEIAASLAAAKRSAPVSAPEQPVVAPVDPEPVSVAPGPVQGPAVLASDPDPEDQIARMGEYVARWEAAQAEREAAAAREARWTATA